MSDVVDVTYRGLKVAQGARLVPDGAGGGFVEHDLPLPVGSKVTIVRNGQSMEARVVSVVEQEQGAKSPPGMKLSWGAAEARDTNVMQAVVEPADGDEAHDTQVMSAVPEPM